MHRLEKWFRITDIDKFRVYVNSDRTQITAESDLILYDIKELSSTEFVLAYSAAACYFENWAETAIHKEMFESTVEVYLYLISHQFEIYKNAFKDLNDRYTYLMNTSILGG